MGTAALSERDYVHEAVDRADLIISIGHDTVEKPPFIMGPNGPTVLHVGYLPATVEEVFFPHAEVVGDVGPSLALLADRLEGKLAIAGRFCRCASLARIAERAEESRYPLTPQRQPGQHLQHAFELAVEVDFVTPQLLQLGWVERLAERLLAEQRVVSSISPCSPI